jgi:hypothetical protein
MLKAMTHAFDIVTETLILEAAKPGQTKEQQALSKLTRDMALLLIEAARDQTQESYELALNALCTATGALIGSTANNEAVLDHLFERMRASTRAFNIAYCVAAGGRIKAQR